MLEQTLTFVFIILLALNGIGLHIALARVERERTDEDSRIYKAMRREIDALRRDMEQDSLLTVMWGPNADGTKATRPRNPSDGPKPI